jgi:uncharacterized protein (DUF433 family)
VKVKNKFQGITKTPGVCGADACIAGTRIPVWIIADYNKAGKSLAAIRRNYPHLSIKQIHRAVLYYKNNRREIEKQIRENQIP